MFSIADNVNLSAGSVIQTVSHYMQLWTPFLMFNVRA